MEETILKTLKNKSALLSYIKACPNKHISKIAESMGIEVNMLKTCLEQHDILDKVILTNMPEKELKDLLIGFKKTRTIIPPYEIDFYSDKYKLGIEFNGAYWHSTEMRDMFYHQEKAQMAWSNGIKLYQIFEWEWDKYKPIILSNIQRLAKCLKREKGIKIKEISSNDAILFLHANTISYDKTFDYSYGLFSNKLIAVMTFKNDVLNNYSESLDTIVENGFGQLFDYHVNKYTPKTLKAFPDLAKYLYDYETRFNIEGCTEPELVWFKTDILTEDKKKFLLNGSKLSEEEQLKKLGYKKLYTCGKIKMVYELTRP